MNAARPECSKLPYTTRADCVGTPGEGDTVRVASGAGRYHPLFYELIGAPALPFHGVAALYVMRAAAALLAWGFFVLALVATRCWARTRWPYVALAVATTPVLAYSATLPAPNGLEMTSAMALWSALLGLAVGSEATRDARLLVIGGLSASVLVTLRSFGPVWCVLILLTVMLAVRVSRARQRDIVIRAKGWVAMVVVLVATLASVAWIRGMGALVVGKVQSPEPLTAVSRAATTSKEAALWVLQAVAAFPTRNEPSHPAVYVAFLIVFGTLVLVAFRYGDARGRIGLAAAGALSLLVPAVVTFSTLQTYGAAWQGRYTLPYSVGIALVSGALLDRRNPRVRSDILVGGGALYVVAHVTGALMVAVHERSTSPGVANGAWILVSPLLLGVLAAAGASLLWFGAVFALGDRPEVTEEVAHDRLDCTGVPLGADR